MCSKQDLVKIVECVPNFSEGRRKEVVGAIRDAAQGVPGVTLLDCESDQNHNRMVLTFVGSPEAVKAAALASSTKAIELIDLRNHRGEHPRMGAVDVVPFVPLKDVTMQECVDIADSFAKEFASKFDVPVFLYESSARREERRNLAKVREGEFEGLRDLIGKDPSKEPDYGPNRIHPSAGATAIGARPILIAYNVDLGTQDLSAAKKIARQVRERDGGLPRVKALGFDLKDRNMVQVSMNLTDYNLTSVHTAFETVSRLALESGIKVAESEIVGLVPLEALVLAFRHYLKMPNFRTDQVIESKLFEVVAETSTIKGGADFLGLPLSDFVGTVSSENPVPGGGSVSAYAGALAAALVAMVCRLTLEKRGYEQVQRRIEEILALSLGYQSKLLNLVNRDAEAYTLVSSAMRLPRTSDAEKEERKKRLQEALKEATEVPSITLEHSSKVFDLAKEVVSIGNKNARSDAETALELSRAAVRGAWSNIKLNLESMKDTDQEYVQKILGKVTPLLQKI